MDTWGEALWTARDLVVEFIVTDPYGAIHGHYAAEGEAMARREYLMSEGVECWVVPVGDLYIEEEPEPCTCTLACEPRGTTEEQACRLSDSWATFLSNRDPGDETDA